MWPDRVSNPGPLIYESGALPTALRGPAISGRCTDDNERLCAIKKNYDREEFASSGARTRDR